MNLTKLILTLILTSNLQPSFSKPEHHTLTRRILLTVGTFGLYPLIESFSKTNEEIIQKAYEKIDYTKLNYGIPISILEQNFKIDELTESQKIHLSKTANETILFNMIHSIKIESIEAYFDNLKILIKDLRNVKNLLQKRLVKLKKLNYLINFTTIKEMQNLIQDIELIVPNILFLNLYISNHKSFFESCNLIKKLYRSYKKEIKLILNENQFLEINLKKIALNKYSKYLNNNFIYTDIIKNDMLELSKISSHNAYTKLAKILISLKNKLCTIQSFITNNT